MALGPGLTSVRSNRGKIVKNGPLVRQKTYKEKKKRFTASVAILKGLCHQFIITLKVHMHEIFIVCF
jgi:hypothetical protein